MIQQEKPQFIFYIAGVDILASDKLGKLKVSAEGCRRRDEFVFEQASKQKMTWLTFIKYPLTKFLFVIKAVILHLLLPFPMKRRGELKRFIICRINFICM